jgi:soluble lytic murein transglycosylase
MWRIETMLLSLARFLATAVVVVSVVAPSARAALPAATVETGRQAFDAVARNQWSEVAALAGRLSDPVAVKLITWHRIIGRDESLSFNEMAAFIDANPDWPWPNTLRQRAEGKIDEAVPPARLIDWFRRHPPQTTRGRVWLARALKATGDTRSATEVAREAWVDGSFNASNEASFLDGLGDLLTGDDHRRRLDRLLWDGAEAEAQRLLPRVDPGTRALAVARLDLRAVRPGVDAVVGRVPPHLQNDPGLVFERVRWRRKKDMNDAARAMLNSHSLDTAAPSLWWTERSILARRALADGLVADAYRTASQHGSADDGDYAEAEFLAGWIALRFLNEPQRAFQHFQQMYGRVTFPISQSRGAYWTGRAAAALGDHDAATRWYRTAAQHPTTFYGQLAALTLTPGRRPALPADPVPSAAERSAFQAHELTRAVMVLRAFGQTPRLWAFILRLAELDESPGWKALAAQLAHDSGRADLGVFVGKQAYQTGHHLIDLGYPTVAVPAGGQRVEPPLILGVIRQESAFRVDAVSPAGARGLMQLMPATAELMAKRTGLPYSQTRLVTDPSYNIALGSGYLDKMLGQFDGSYILSLAAYNAGPGRSQRWRAANGRPSDSIEAAVDWIEAIPFTETRNYVQRTLENLQVYRTKLGAQEGGGTLDRDLLR